MFLSTGLLLTAAITNVPPKMSARISIIHFILFIYARAVETIMEAKVYSSSLDDIPNSPVTSVLIPSSPWVAIININGIRIPITKPSIADSVKRKISLLSAFIYIRAPHRATINATSSTLGILINTFKPRQIPAVTKYNAFRPLMALKIRTAAAVKKKYVSVLYSIPFGHQFRFTARISPSHIATELKSRLRP